VHQYAKFLLMQQLDPETARLMQHNLTLGRKRLT